MPLGDDPFVGVNINKMIITGINNDIFRSFKIGYSRGLPSSMAPKLLTNKKTEEYFITSLLAQTLLNNQIPVIGVDVCEDDKDKGADTVIKILNDNPISIQVTRFTLTDFLKRKKVAKTQIDSIIDQVLALSKVEFAINVTVNSLKQEKFPLNNQKMKNALATEIADAININKNVLGVSNEFVNVQIKDERIIPFSTFLTLQSIPKGFFSNFHGKDNVFIDFAFDIVNFDVKDIKDECNNIFNKKNGGKAKVLIIWADAFDILYDPIQIIDQLIIQFKETTFENVMFFSFFNNIELFTENRIKVAQIK